jgi:hypothetical protein
MTDVSIGEMPPELVPPLPPVPEATAELDAAPPQAAAVDGLAPATDQGVAAPTEFAPAVEVAPPSVEDGERVLPEIEHAIGATRQAILDHFIDSEGDQSMSQIKATLPNVLPATVEACVRREWQQGRLLRVSAGVYRLAPAKLPEAKPAPQPLPTPTEEATWFAALDGWINDPETWDRERFGPRPNEPGRRIPAGVVAKGVDRNRKRLERQRDREAAQARQSAADRELRDRLIAATGGNIVRGPGIDDVSPIQMAMQLVPLDRIVSAIRARTDKKLYPGNEPATSWREPRLLKEIAESYCRTDIVPRLVDAWSKAGRAQAPTAQNLPPADQMPDDIDELRRHHDDPHAPPGPHNLPKPDAAPSAPDTAQKAADASELLLAVSSHPRTGKRIDGATAAA